MTITLAVLAAVLFAFVDYVGYNGIGAGALKTYRILFLSFGKGAPMLYRVLQTIIQVAFVWVLWCILGNFWVAFSFLFLWWTFNCDMIYYMFCGWLRWFPQEPVNAFNQDVMGDQVVWAWWTPYGLIRGRKSEPIDGATLVVQAIGGVMFALTVQGFASGVFCRL